MKKQKFRVGDRVTDDYLGHGTIEKIIDTHGYGIFLVRLDTAPSVQYNMGQNPTLMFGETLVMEDAAE